MLIRFSVENLFSFKEQEVFSMLPGKGSLKSDHKNKKVNQISTLKSAVIFGANASGKSNLIRAVNFGKDLILESDWSSYAPFKLSHTSSAQATVLEYQIQQNKKNYTYGFSCKDGVIEQEWLHQIIDKEEKNIFIRKEGEFTFSRAFNTKIGDERFQEIEDFLTTLSNLTKPNQLLLHIVTQYNMSSMEHNSYIDSLIAIADWFQNKLVVMFPDASYDGFLVQLKTHDQFREFLKDALHYFGTGVDDIRFNPVNIDEIGLPANHLSSIKNHFVNKPLSHALLSINNKTKLLLEKKENTFIALELQTIHYSDDNAEGIKKPILFELEEESDGTRRLMDMLPLIYRLLNGQCTIFIDEPERSMHPNLIYDCFQLFFDGVKEKNAQFIIATHESALLTQKLFRKDEIWFVSKEKGTSKLSSLEEYRVRFDKNIREDYLKGRFKGVPQFGARELILNKEGDESDA